jgi:hypothetical protein
LIAGIPKRTLQAFAAAGGIPGAGKPAGRWTFDVEELRRWARKGEQESAMPNLYKRGETWWARFKVLGVEYRRSLRTSVRSEAERRLAGLRKQVEGEARFGVAEPRTFAAAADSWKQHCTRDLSAQDREALPDQHQAGVAAARGPFTSTRSTRPSCGIW